MPGDDRPPAGKPLEDPPADEFLVEDMFPTKRVHLIAGPVGAGKTTYIYQLARTALDESDFMEHRTPHRGGRIVYVAADRTRREANATLRRMGALDLIPRIKWIFANEIRQKGVIPFLETLIEQNCKEGDTVIVEPFQFFLRDDKNKAGDPNSYMDVSHWICKVKDAVEKQGVTLFGSVHPPKAKKGEGYASVRDKLIGTSAWTAFTSTTVYIEPTDPDDVTSPYRTIHVLVRDGKNFTMEYMQEPEHGLLVPVPSAKPFKSALDLGLDAHPDEVFTLEHVREWLTGTTISWPTVERWLKGKVDNKNITRVSRGVYRKIQASQITLVQ
jgi:hypothetical protein